MARLHRTIGIPLSTAAEPKRPVQLLGPGEIRQFAEELGVRPTKAWGQNFVHDANTVRRIVTASGITADDVAMEIGPGLGSLTLAMLEITPHVIAVEIDPTLAGRLPQTIAARSPQEDTDFRLLHADAMQITKEQVASLAGSQGTTADSAGQVPADKVIPTALVANLPYNISVPVLLHALTEFPSIRTSLVMVQAEVADRLAATPGGRIYGVPSVKARFFGEVRRAGSIGRNVFWPAPNVDSGLMKFDRYEVSPWPQTEELRVPVFAAIDAAFAQRRKTLRAALASWAGSPTAAEERLRAAGIDPSARGETLEITDFVRLVQPDIELK